MERILDMDTLRSCSAHKSVRLASRIVLIAFIAAIIAFAGLLPLARHTGQTCAVSFVYAETANEPAEEPVDPFKADPVTTSITCVKKDLSKDSLGAIFADTIKVSPAYGRTVYLYRYNESADKWETAASFVTANTETASIKIVYPNSAKHEYCTKWKISAPRVAATREHPALKSRTVSTKTYFNIAACDTAIVMDAQTGEVLFDKNMSQKHKIASITKLMTVHLFSQKVRGSKKIKITKEAATTPYTYNLTTGDKIKAKNLVYLAIMQSNNGSATQMALTVSGTQTKFAKLMNKTAKQLGMLNTNYTTPSGLDTGSSNSTGNYSTAYDQALLCKYILNYKGDKMMKAAMQTSCYKFKSAKKKYTIYTTNSLLGVDGNFGMKTGTEDIAGYCNAAAYRIDGRNYVIVFTGARNYPARWDVTKALRSYIDWYIATGGKA